MSTDEEIIEELRVHMVEHGWSKPKAAMQSRWWFDFLAPRIRQQAEEAKSAPVLKPGEIAACDLVVGDIVEERHTHWSRRKIVTKMTAKSAVFRTDNGQDGRAALTLKRKGKLINQTVIKVGHYDLTPDVLGALESYYTMGDIRRERWMRGLLEDLPPFWEIFGYDSRDALWHHKPHKGAEIIDTITTRSGDRIQIMRYNEERTYVQGKEVPITTWGARVMDPEHDHTFASLGWRYRDQETVGKLIGMFEQGRARGYDLETTTHVVCRLGNDNLPKADRWDGEK